MRAAGGVCCCWVWGAGVRGVLGLCVLLFTVWFACDCGMVVGGCYLLSKDRRGCRLDCSTLWLQLQQHRAPTHAHTFIPGQPCRPAPSPQDGLMSNLSAPSRKRLSELGLDAWRSVTAKKDEEKGRRGAAGGGAGAEDDDAGSETLRSHYSSSPHSTRSQSPGIGERRASCWASCGSGGKALKGQRWGCACSLDGMAGRKLAASRQQPYPPFSPAPFSFHSRPASPRPQAPTAGPRTPLLPAAATWARCRPARGPLRSRSATCPTPAARRWRAPAPGRTRRRARLPISPHAPPGTWPLLVSRGRTAWRRGRGCSRPRRRPLRAARR